jgi:hypothetical protein
VKNDVFGEKSRVPLACVCRSLVSYVIVKDASYIVVYIVL